MVLRMLFFPFILLLVSSAQSVLASDKGREEAAKQRNSVRGRPEITDNADSAWRKDPHVLDPKERMEIEDKTHSNSHKSTIGPFLGPIVNLGEDISDNKKEQADTPQISSRIVHGSEAEPHSFFAMLLVKDGRNWRWSGCGGTLVSDCHVVTAGHCVFEQTLPVKGVFINAYSPFAGNNSGIPYHFSRTERTEIHPDFDLPTNRADLAIIHMEECVDVSDYPPALLADDIEEYRVQYRPPRGYPRPPSISMQVLGFGSMMAEENGKP